MTTLMWQTALLLVGAYFLGAWIACLVRRTVFAPAPAGVAVPAPMQADPVSDRFERALTGQGRAPAAAQAAGATDRNAALMAAARSVGALQRKLAPAPAPAANAQAAAALSAAAASAQRRQPGPPERSPAVVLPAAAGTSGPAAVAAPVAVPIPPRSTAPIRPPAAPVALPADDLTRIRAIDPALQARLNALGVRRFAEIAEWRAGDIARVGAAINAQGRIERENWIEQAQVLAKAGETYYSSRKARGKPDSAEPASDRGERIALPAAAASAAAARAADRAAPAAGMGKDNLQRIGGIDGEVERQLNARGVSRYSQVAGWSSNDVARFERLLGIDGRIARENWVEQAQILGRGGATAFSRSFDRRGGEAPRPVLLSEAIRQAAGAAEGEPAAASRGDISGLRSVKSAAYRAAEAAAVAAGAPGAGRGADDLKRIRGVGVLIEKKLSSMGITRYGQIANWTADDIERVSTRLDFKGRIERENWVEQARILSSGGQTDFSRRVDRGEVEKPQ